MAKKITKQASEVKTIDQLQADLIVKRNDLIEAKRGNKMGELTNPCVIKLNRKTIARIKTAIRADQIAAKENK
jgi:ribosomal protein L29